MLDADIILPKNSLQKFIKDKKKNLLMVNPKNLYNRDDIIVNLNKNEFIEKVFIKKKISDFGDNFSSAGVIKMSHSATKIFSELSLINKSSKNQAYYEDAYKNLFKKFLLKFYT